MVRARLPYGPSESLLFAAVRLTRLLLSEHSNPSQLKPMITTF